MVGDIMTFIRTVISFDVLRTNNSGSALILGEIVAQPATTGTFDANEEVESCDITQDNEISRPVGVVTQTGGISDGATGLVITISGIGVEVAMVAGLTPTLGEEVIVSTTSGRGTIPGSGIGEPVNADTVLQRVGIINDLTPYAGSQRVGVQLDLSQRRLN